MGVKVCPICRGFSSPTWDNVVMHIVAYHYNSPVDCPFQCQVELKNGSELWEHWEKHPISCNHCKLRHCDCPDKIIPPMEENGNFDRCVYLDTRLQAQNLPASGSYPVYAPDFYQNLGPPPGFSHGFNDNTPPRQFNAYGNDNPSYDGWQHPGPSSRYIFNPASEPNLNGNDRPYGYRWQTPDPSYGYEYEQQDYNYEPAQNILGYQQPGYAQRGQHQLYDPYYPANMGSYDGWHSHRPPYVCSNIQNGCIQQNANSNQPLQQSGHGYEWNPATQCIGGPLPSGWMRQDETRPVYSTHVEEPPLAYHPMYHRMHFNHTTDRYEDPQPGPSNRQSPGIPIPRATKRAMSCPQKDEDIKRYNDFRRSKCPYCPETIQDKKKLLEHVIKNHRNRLSYLDQVGSGNETEQLQLNFASSKLDAYHVYSSDVNGKDIKDVNVLFNGLREQTLNVMNENLKGKKKGELYRSYRVQFEIECQFMKETAGDTSRIMVPMQSFFFHVENEEWAKEVYEMAAQHFIARIEEFQRMGSNWVLEQITKFDVTIAEIKKFCGGGKPFDLPDLLKHKYRTMINVPGDDGKCFQRCIIAAMTYDDMIPANRYRTLQRKQNYLPYLDNEVKGVNLRNLGTYVDMRKILKFENDNPNVGLNVFLWDENLDSLEGKTKDCDVISKTNPFKVRQGIVHVGSVRNTMQFADSSDDVEFNTSSQASNAECVDVVGSLPSGKKGLSHDEESKRHESMMEHIYPWHVPKEKKKTIIDLLLIWDGVKGHFCYIPKFKGFFCKPTNTHIEDICRYCMNNLGATTYQDHEHYCSMLGLQKVRYPSNDDKGHFKRVQNCIKLPYVFYADLETVAEPYQDKKTGGTIKTDKHRVSGYSFALMKDGKMEKCESFQTDDRNVNVVDRMLESMIKIHNKIKLQIQADEKKAYEVAKDVLKDHPLPKINDPKPSCYFCKKPVYYKDAVRHHEHSGTFEYKGIAHNRCNLNAKQQAEKINVFYHNLKGFDGHFILKAASQNRVKDINVIGGSAEKFFGITINGDLNMYDSLNFFHSSLDGMVNTLNGKLPITRTELEKRYGKGARIELLLRKGVYPYSYVDSFDKYKETELPPAEMFRDKLSNKDISPDEYTHAKNVWDAFEIKDLREYTELYCLTDTLLLSDCFEAMRSMFIKEFTLDPAHYISLPMLSFDCCLKHTKCEYEYITDPTMHAWIELSKRGGMAVGGDLRAFKANNPYVPDYDQTKPTTYIQILDLVNLYPYCMAMALPFKDFAWVKGDDWDELINNPLKFIGKTGKNDETGYMYEVDLMVPEDKHKYLEQLTPAPYRRKTDYDELSDFTAWYTDVLDPDHVALRAERLICDLLPRKNYIVHYRTLQLYLRLGFKLTKVHKALQFTQGPIFKEYVELLAQKRKDAKTDVEKNFFKLLGNVLFGKTCENVRDRCQFIIVRDRDEAIKYNSKPNVKRVIILNNDPDEPELAIVCLKKVSCYLDRPVYMGTTTLDLAKYVYYDFFYSVAKPIWDRPEEGKRLHCLGGDTDSAFLMMETPDVYNDILSKKDEFDLSNFPANHKIWKNYHDPTNEKRLGKMKDEMAGKVVSHFVYLKPKMYTYRYVDTDMEEIEVDGKKEKVYKFKEFTHGGVYKDCKKGKGIARQALTEQCDFDQFTKCLEAPVQFYTKSNHIRSYKHDVYNVEITKSSLNGLNYKRYDLPCGTSLPFGHKDIKLYKG